MNGRKKQVVMLCIVGAGLAVLYWPVLVSLVQDWGSNDNYSHGYLIPLIAGYMLYSRRDRIKSGSPEVYWPGIVLVVSGLLLLILATAGAEFFLQRLSLLIVLAGILLFLFGQLSFRIFFLPILYLIFMIPLPALLWNKMAFPLQLLVSSITEQIVTRLGIPMLQEGNILQLPMARLEVVEACSGLRSLVMLCAISAALAGLPDYKGYFLTFWRGLLLFLSAVPAAILLNTLRLTVTSLLVYRYGPDVTKGFFHEIAGLLVFMLGLGLLLFIRHLFETERQGAHQKFTLF